MFVLYIISRVSSRRNKEKYIYSIYPEGEVSIYLHLKIICESILKPLATVKSRKKNFFRLSISIGNHQLFILESCTFLLFTHLSSNPQNDYVRCEQPCECVCVCMCICVWRQILQLILNLHYQLILQ